jgi:hypothetical protein
VIEDGISNVSDDEHFVGRQDENHNEYEHHKIKNLVTEFPDPYDYIIGFVCHS